MSVSDADLIARVLADDDRNAFAELVRQNQSAVRGLLRKLTGGDVQRADDLAQETFLRAYRGLSGFSGETRFSAWLFRIAYRIFLSDLRAKKRLGRAAPPPEEAAAELRGAEAPLAEGALLRLDLMRAMGRLAPEERAALALTYGQDISHEEAAAILQWPLGTLKTQVARAKEHLRKCLLDYEARPST
jgi:RNA polymerase sigma factor (sigma-70 family)